MDNTSDEKSNEIPEFFLEKKEKPENKKLVRKSFGLKKNLTKQNWLKKMKHL